MPTYADGKAVNIYVHTRRLSHGSVTWRGTTIDDVAKGPMLTAVP